MIDHDLLDLLRPDWMDEGACNGMDPEVFFPTRTRATNPGRAGCTDPTTPARRVCAGCPVRETCLEYALARNIEHGVWGGESERSRRRIRRQRRLAA